MIAMIAILCGGCDEYSPPMESRDSSASTYNPMQHNAYRIVRDPELGALWRVTAQDGVADSDVVKMLYEPDPRIRPHLTSGEALQTLDTLLAEGADLTEMGQQQTS